MKQLLLFIVSVIFIVMIFGWINHPGKNTKALSEKKPQVKTASSPIDGAWQLVWQKRNDTLLSPTALHQFKMFSNGIFSLLATDSSGNITYAGYGKYELDGNSYKETFIYHDVPRFRGAIDWQEYKLTGDTLYMKGFIKIIINGKDETANSRKSEEKRVRVKW